MIKAEDIVKANESLPKVDVKGKGYVMVTERIKAFRQILPNGSIDTQILSMENGIVTIQAKIYDNDHLLASGLAQEKESSSFINKTSYVENCETSAVGRALGMLGIGVDESMASAEEVATAIKNQGENKGSTRENKDAKVKTAPTSQSERDKISAEVREHAHKQGLSDEDVVAKYHINKSTPIERLKEVLADLKNDPADAFEAIDEQVPWEV